MVLKRYNEIYGGNSYQLLPPAFVFRFYVYILGGITYNTIANLLINKCFGN